MNSWFLFALGAAAFSAAVNIIDKTVLVKWMRRADGSLAPFAFLEAFAGITALMILGFPRMGLHDLVASLLAGASYGIAAVCYFRALKIGEVSRLIPFYDIIPLLTLLFATIFLGERLEPQHYLAIALIVGGALMLSVRHKGAFKVAPGTGAMLLTILFTAAGAILGKYALGFADPWAVFGWSRVGSAIVILPFIRPATAAFVASVRRFGWPVVAATGASETLTVLVTLLFILAADAGPVSLVSALVGTHPLFLVLFAAGLSYFRPEFLKEERTAFSIVRKLAAVGLMVVGGALVV